jgi:hypothetical protein
MQSLPLQQDTVARELSAAGAAMEDQVPPASAVTRNAADPDVLEAAITQSEGAPQETATGVAGSEARVQMLPRSVVTAAPDPSREMATQNPPPPQLTAARSPAPTGAELKVQFVGSVVVVLCGEMVDGVVLGTVDALGIVVTATVVLGGGPLGEVVVVGWCWGRDVEGKVVLIVGAGPSVVVVGPPRALRDGCDVPCSARTPPATTTASTATATPRRIAVRRRRIWAPREKARSRTRDRTSGSISSASSM